ncbi:uncharacterized protein K441DRAFT_661434 [Cenococcum geophilum 1.58]|uniref:uncharacterized protein n=1 Tax=Cenococcum geophilum 1.58 TaxID=794803 RepID=UPI00358E88F8|nr:hypothetical protein K441DRAFT_661434 [Cenococcum geophilum 1.58]
MRNSGRYLAHPDYTLSTTQVYQKTAWDIIKTTKSLSDLAPYVLGNVRNDLPSWVPDWSATNGYTYRDHAESTKLYNATGSDLPSIHVYEDHVLQMPGFWIDRIASIGDTMLSDGDIDIRVLFQWYQHFIVHFQIDRNPEAFNMGDAFWRTLCADLVAVHSEAHDQESISDLTFRRANDFDLPLFASWCANSSSSPFREYCDRVVGDELRLEYEHCRAHFTRIGHPRTEEQFREISKAYYSFVSPIGVPRVDTTSLLIRIILGHALSQPLPPREHTAAMSSPIKYATFRRKIFITRENFIGLGPAEMKVDDQIYLLQGSRTPFIPRQAKEECINGLLKRYYQLVGDCYMHGVMDGEALARV